VGKPKCSAEIESPSDALEYVRERMVGDHIIVFGEQKVTIRFTSEESDAGIIIVRTAYPMTGHEFKNLLAASGKYRSPWPPKYR
jgi:hypothetical protein